MADVEEAANGVAGPELQTMEAASSAPAAVRDRPVDERLLFCAEVLIGYKVEVQVRVEQYSAALPAQASI